MNTTKTKTELILAMSVSEMYMLAVPAIANRALCVLEPGRDKRKKEVI